MKLKHIKRRIVDEYFKVHAPKQENQSNNSNFKNTNKIGTMKKVKAVQDDNGHWYVIPDELSSKFYELDEKIGSENVKESEESENEFGELFDQYMTGGDLNNIQLYAEI